MKPTKNQIKFEASKKSQEYYEELIICSKMARKANNANYRNIKTKFWKMNSKLEKLTKEFPDILTASQKLKLDQFKLKF